MEILRTTDLTKKYGEQVALDIPELVLNEGELIGLVGNNGAGKTTLMRLILDLIEATTGEVLSNGLDVRQTAEWKEYTGSFIDDSFLIDFYTPEEYFEFIAEVYHIGKEELQHRLESFRELMADEVLGKKKYIKSFSMGNRQKIGIIGAMLIRPRVLILDEPFNYLDPSSQIIVARLIRQMNQELGTTVLISSHNLTSIADISQRILLLEKGKLIKDLSNEPGSHAFEELEEYFGQ